VQEVDLPGLGVDVAADRRGTSRLAQHSDAGERGQRLHLVDTEHALDARDLLFLHSADDARRQGVVALVVHVGRRNADVVEVVARRQLEHAVAVELRRHRHLVATGESRADLDEARAFLVDLHLHVERRTSQAERLDDLGRVDGDVGERLLAAAHLERLEIDVLLAVAVPPVVAPDVRDEDAARVVGEPVHGVLLPADELLEQHLTQPERLHRTTAREQSLLVPREVHADGTRTAAGLHDDRPRADVRLERQRLVAGGDDARSVEAQRRALAQPGLHQRLVAEALDDLAGVPVELQELVEVGGNEDVPLVPGHDAVEPLGELLAQRARQLVEMVAVDDVLADDVASQLPRVAPQPETAMAAAGEQEHRVEPEAVQEPHLVRGVLVGRVEDEIRHGGTAAAISSRRSPGAARPTSSARAARRSPGA
jgi:hypothetical protein